MVKSFVFSFKYKLDGKAFVASMLNW